MKTVKNLYHSAGKVLFSCLIVLFTHASAFAVNIADSDLSNSAGTNKNWLNSFWFFVCVAFLVAAAVIGFSNKYTRVRRDYKGPADTTKR
ncbi:hypothetical protein [Desertivirga brevis]|uniref:hypothetical protein n=1 Tax=Desertivirga brevis TaxID=2810310 RepID=UPI001A96CDAA|nr:hypothetical protein [Pedobacter sp. SYSU D00873]